MEYLKKSIELHKEDASALVHLGNLYRALSSILHKESLEAQQNKTDSVVDSQPNPQYRGRTGSVFFALSVLIRKHNYEQSMRNKNLYISFLSLHYAKTLPE